MSDVTIASTIETQISNITAALEDKEEFIHSASYEIGLLGLSLYYCYYAKYTGDERYYGKAEEYLVKGLSALDLPNFKRLYASDSLDSHLAHIGRFLEFSKLQNFLDMDTQEYLQDLDKTLSGLMQSKISIGDFDINSGAMAAGFYYLSRLKNEPSVSEQLSILVHGIKEQAIKDEDGDYYWSSPSLFQRVYLGISHGSCLVISFLANACEQNIEQEACKEILRKAVNFVLKQRWYNNSKGLFPNFIGDPIEPKQFSLCYGDLGVGYALFRAAGVLDDEALSAAVTEILDDCLLRSGKDKLTLDASIIYGAAGLAATYEKLYRLSGDSRFDEAADYWYEQIPAYAVHENEFAGYKTRLLDVGPVWNVSFGWGIIGIGISLMIYKDRSLPPIDALILCA
ncbi:hypothetical protein GO495_27510 [Chitinophaga oryziterrae]|uniref:Lanthionine synthetase C family protein n=1 Tax=Chitinophaga oryziterrae TaxID=1031224 RepID=A0A6N8JJM9_9BACT|nr:lanthionine synthetase LanC family protein [Chitinophaga oryziterrae]MVT44372.1 hypothetical protein [Chitinophaga oryziterrae]